MSSNIHCFFEQSNTFRDAFNSCGFKAKSYDIAGNPDVKIDLFDFLYEARQAIAKPKYKFTWQHNENLFNDIHNGDLVFAFVPCTHFSRQNNLLYSNKNANRTYSIGELRKRDMQRHCEFQHLLTLIELCNHVGAKLIVENPKNSLIAYGSPLTWYTDNDRSVHGDLFRKPTSYGANFGFNLDRMFQHGATRAKTKSINHVSQNRRSDISKEYAQWFVHSLVECDVL